MRRGIASGTNRFNLFDSENGDMLLGVVTVQLPPFEVATNTFSGAGVGGEINVPAHGMMQPLPVAISIPHIYDKAVRFFQLGVGTITLDLRRDLAVTNPDTHAIENVPDRWVIKGPITKSDPGKAEQKASSDASVEIQAYYCQHFLDGDEILQWDPFTPIHKVNGVDLLAEMKANIGL